MTIHRRLICLLISNRLSDLFNPFPSAIPHNRVTPLNMPVELTHCMAHNRSEGPGQPGCPEPSSGRLASQCVHKSRHDPVGHWRGLGKGMGMGSTEGEELFFPIQLSLSKTFDSF
jgi:hypothetical protein